MLATGSGPATRDGLLERLSDAQRQSDDLFRLLPVESLYDRPIPERHRIIFYLGHLEAFDWNLLQAKVFDRTSPHPDFDRLFAFGIDPVKGELPHDRPSDWPSVQAVREYAGGVRAALEEQLGRHHEPRSGSSADALLLDTLLQVAVEHRLMHVETLSYMLHQLPLDRKIAQKQEPSLAAIPVVARMMEIPSGLATLGLRPNPEAFGWDNEYESHRVYVPAFAIDQYKVTNQEYLKFLASGGYETRAFWSDEDWNWKIAQGISHPVFWKATGDRWLYRGMFREVPLPLTWPVYVSHAEASAYARWAGKSLPSEAEWHRTAYGTAGEKERIYPWGDEMPGRGLGNFDFDGWDPTPVNAFPDGRSAFGVDDLLGNGWEWTSTAFAAFPGFAPFPFYKGYSADFFDGKHFVMKGGSARTARCMLRPSFRNWFQARYQYVYAGFRCVSH